MKSASLFLYASLITHRHTYHTTTLLLLVASILFTACDGTKFVPDGEYLLTQNHVLSADPNVKVGDLASYVQQRPNSKWFSSIKVPLGIYSMAGRDTTKAINRRLMKWGQPPVILDTAKVNRSASLLTQAMQNRGYLDTDIETLIEKNHKRASVTYLIQPQQQYTLRSVRYDIADARIDSILRADNILTNDGLKAGSPFTITDLHNERNRITNYLNNNGFYYFNKEAITFIADSSHTDHAVDVTMNLGLYRRSSHEELRQHPLYTIANVTYRHQGDAPLNIRQSTLDNNNLIEVGQPYSAQKVQQTYNKYARLQAIRSTNIHITEHSDSTLDVELNIQRKKPNAIKIQPEGTNTAGDLGAALSVSYENRNLFHGSEQFSLSVRGAYEAIRQLEGYEENSNFIELGAEAKLTLPVFASPWLSKQFHQRHNATSEVRISYNSQRRPEFRRTVLTAGWGYKWNARNNILLYHLDVVDFNYISMPWISETFKKEYLDDSTTRNAILRYNYQDLLIMRLGFGVTYNDGTNYLKANVETAGNLLDAIAHTFHNSQNDQGQYKVWKVAYAQYAKMDVDYTHLLKFDQRNTLALHARIGLGVPYGNSSMLPYEKRYFSGGANSVRGWNVRSLGPGRFIGQDGKIDFINQTGDIKLDLNAELRTDLFWKFAGAVFIDAGNIWTIRQYDDQPGGELTFKNLWEAMAVAYGVGLRLNLNYFILRLDLGMKAINPAFTTTDEHYPITHINFKRDYSLHFAVGLPF